MVQAIVMLDWLKQLPRDVDLWAEAFQQLPSQTTHDLARTLVKDWAEGRLEEALLPARLDPKALLALRRSLSWVVSSLDEVGFDLEIEHWDLSDQALQRWCWVAPWLLISQDEDLLLMDEEHYSGLLEQATLDCPKRDYVISSIEHGIRDGVHHVLRNQPESLPQTLTQAGRWIEPARRARAEDLAAYCERLARYGVRSEVDAPGATSRASDLNRCHVLPAPVVERHGGSWSVRLDGHDRKALLIDASTGHMRLA